jgi:uncharacterized repeat protein (TIGR02543 family)
MTAGGEWVDLKLVRCTTCGNQIEVTPESKTVICDACGNSFLVSQGHELSKKEEKDIIQIKKLRENLERSIKIDDINSILHFSQEILSVIPSDYRSGYFFAYATSKLTNPKALYAFYQHMNIEATDTEIDTVFDHITRNFDLRDYSIVKNYFEILHPTRINQLNQDFDYRSRLEDHYANVPRDVFICHRSTDAIKAQEILSELELDGHQCWISSRNLRPNDNENYWKNISEAIENCSIFLVVSSRNSMLSKDVQREISIAEKLDKARIEVKIDDSVHTTLFKHFFNGIKWINAISSLNLAMEELKQRVLDLELNSKRDKKIDSKYIKSTQGIQSSVATANVGNLIKRMMMELEGKNTVTALEYAERILDIDVETYDAWVVKFLVANDVFSRGEFLRKIQNSTDLTYLSGIKEQSNYSKMIKFSPDKSFEVSITNKLNDFARNLKSLSFSKLDIDGYNKLSQLLDEPKKDIFALFLMNHRMGSINDFDTLFSSFDNIGLINSLLQDLKNDKQFKSVKDVYQEYSDKLQQLITRKNNIEEEKRLEEERQIEEKRLKEEQIKRDFIQHITDLLIAGDFSIALDQLVQTKVLNKEELIYCELNFLAVQKCSSLDEFFQKYKNEESINMLEETIETSSYKNYLKISENEQLLIFDKQSKVKIEQYYIRIKQERKEQRIKRFKKSLWFMIPLLIIIISMSILTPTVIIPNSDYNEAMQLIADGRYEEASRILSNIEGFSDSKNQIAIVDAYQKFEEGSFEEAITLIEEIGEVEIQYDLDGGQNLNQLSGLILISLSNKTPIKEGYTFLSWELTSYTINNEKNNYSAEVFLKAKWQINQYTITFNSNGGSSLEDIIQDYQSDITEPSEPIKIGYTFGGWFIDEELTNQFVFNTMPAQNILLYARWLLDPYTITLELNGGTGITTIFDDFGKTIEEPIVTKIGYTFVGWYLTSDFSIPYEFSTMPAEDLTVYARWLINPYTITLELNGGTGITSIIEEFGTDITEPTITKTGYIFDGWYYDQELTIPFVFNTMEEDLTIYAKWEINQYTITFETNEGTEVSAITQDFNSNLSAPTNPSLEGYTFSGWYSNIEMTNEFTFATMPAEDIILYAKWSINQYEVNYIVFDNDYDPLVGIPLYPDETIIGINLGYYHSLAYTSKGRVFTWGYNNYGQLGDGTTTTKYTPTEITSQFNFGVGETIISINLGHYNSSVLTSTGRVFTWGNNGNGQLGDGTTTTKYTPTEITSQFVLGAEETIISMSLGEQHSSALTSTGRIFTWGGNKYGELGDGTSNAWNDQLTPTEITNHFNLGLEETIISINLGHSHSSALTSTGRVFTWGYNNHGQLGNGTTVDQYTPIDITSQFNLDLGETIIGINVGPFHSLAFTSIGKVFTWGLNDKGQLGDDSTTDKNTPTEITTHFNFGLDETIISINLGYSHSSAVSSIGRVFTWGNNYSGQLGDGTTTDRTTPTEITSRFNLDAGETIISINVGISHSSALSSTGRVFTWGYNNYGQLGDGTTTTKYTPEINVATSNLIQTNTFDYSSSITEYVPVFEGYTFDVWYTDMYLTLPYSFIIMETSDLNLFGKRAIIQYQIEYNLASGTNNIDNPNSYNIETATIAFEDPSKEGYTFLGWYDNETYNGDALTNIEQGSIGDITLFAKWEINQYDILYNIVYIDGLGDIQLIDGETIVGISLGQLHSSAYTSLGRLLTWGENGSGQLGDGTTIDRLTPIEITSEFNLDAGETIISINLREAYSSALTSTGRVFTWGNNYSGQLGDGTTTRKTTPTEITSRFNLGLDEKIISISLGGDHSSALTSTGRIFTWGGNRFGQLGDGTSSEWIKQLTPTEITSHFNLGLGETIISINLGGNHSSALTSTGRVFTWGANGSGQSGVGHISDIKTPTEITNNFNLGLNETIISINLGHAHSSALSSTGRVFTWGYNENGELGDGTIQITRTIPTEITNRFNLGVDETIISINLGGFHSSALSSTGRVFTWGYNNYGQLGDSTTITRAIPTEITTHFNLGLGETIISINLGLSHSSALSSTGKVFTWGANGSGQIGDGTTSTKFNPTEITVASVNLIQTNTFDYSSSITEYMPVFEGYTFNGWYIDSDLTLPYSFITMGASDLNLFGKWTINQYQIEYNLDSEINDLTNPNSYNVETATITLAAPTKEGYTFLGWYDNETYNGDAVINIEQGTVGDISLYAKWEINQYEINYIIFDNDYDPLNDIPLYPGETITSISLGASYSSVLTSDGRLFTWGYNSGGQLGNGTTVDQYTPIDITSYFYLNENEIITSISMGWSHSSALTSEGRLFTWGGNYFGQLGDGTTIDRLIPTEITSNFNLAEGEIITNISLGGHSSALTSEGRLFTWGGNSYGELGDGTTTSKNTPTEITNQFSLGIGERIVGISLGHLHSSAYTSLGRLFTWGENENGRLGDGTTTDRWVPTEITNQFSLYLDETITNVSLGDSHSSALTSNGRVFTWGSNSNGQLGDSTTITRATPTEITTHFNLGLGETIISINLGNSHSSALTSTGKVFTWGANGSGQLGDGTYADNYSPTEITSQFILGAGETIVSISFGRYHSSVFTSSGFLFTWGYNSTGQLGDGTIIDRLNPIKLSFTKSILVHTNIFTFGTNVVAYEPNPYGYIFDELYEDITFLTPYVYGNMPAHDVGIFGTRTLTEYQIEYNLDGGINNILNLDSYNIETPTIDFENPIKEGYSFLGWYDNTELNGDVVTYIEQGSLGNVTLYAKWEINQYDVNYIIFDNEYDPLNDIALNPGETIKSISLGYEHSVAMSSQGRIFTWGSNRYGKLGDGTTINKNFPIEITNQFDLYANEKIVCISSGYFFSSVLTSTGRVFTWGLNNYGQLGDGTIIEKYTPTEITNHFNLSVGETIISLSLGGTHASAVTSNGRVFTWGSNLYGQLGDATTIQRNTPTEITSHFNLSIDEIIISTSLGSGHSSALTSNNRVFTWGLNQEGQLGDGTTTSRLTPTEITSKFNLEIGETIISISFNAIHSSALTSSGRMFTWGYNNYGQLGNGTSDYNLHSIPTEITNQFNLNAGELITDIFTGQHISSVITSEDRIFTWGWNDYGQLGDGTTTQRGTPTEITNRFNLNLNEEIVSMSLGGMHSSALTSSGHIFTWGFNSNGQLGDGTSSEWINQLTPTEIMPVIYPILDNVDTLDFGLRITEYIPVLEGYTFEGWFSNIHLTSQYSFTTIGSFDLNVYGKWTPNLYTANYILNNGESNITEEDYAESELLIPAYTGYEFGGWYKDITLSIPYESNTFPTSNMTLYAKWYEIFSITYNLDNGINDVDNPITYTSNDDAHILFEPTKEGYTFVGWYDNSEFTGDILTEITAGSIGDISLYAKWQINQYEMNYIIFEDAYDPITDVPLNPGEIITSVSLGGGGSHTAVITSQGRIFTWGLNTWGQLGDGTTTNSSTPIDITSQFGLVPGESITSVSLGGNNSAVLTSLGRIFTFGYNDTGQLGDGTLVNKSTPIDITSQFNLIQDESIIEIFSGGSHIVGITSSGRLFTWGKNSSGQLGDGTLINKSTPIDITSQLNLIQDESIIEISLGDDHSAVLTSNGRMFTWGYNAYGQIGNNTFIVQLTPTEITDKFYLIDGDMIIKISMGGSFSSALSLNGRLFTWGNNFYGMLGNGTANDSALPNEIMSSFTLNPLEIITNISLGAYHSAAITSEGRIFTWGLNNTGQLGDGTDVNTPIPKDITSQFILSSGDIFTDISLGGTHTSVLTLEGQVFVWGNNDRGQIGDGTQINRLIPTKLSFFQSTSYQIDILDFEENIVEYVPNRTGYTFEGWYSDPNLTTLYVFAAMPANDVVLYGKWNVI